MGNARFSDEFKRNCLAHLGLTSRQAFFHAWLANSAQSR